MKNLFVLGCSVFVLIIVSGCTSSSETPFTNTSTSTPTIGYPTTTATLIPTSTAPPILSPTPITPTPTYTLRPTNTSTRTPQLTPLPSLEPNQAEWMIRELLRGPIECPIPCFGGIFPGKTTYGEARNILLRLRMYKTNRLAREETIFYEYSHEFDGGLEVSLVLKVQEDIVKSFDIDINPPPYEDQKYPREWSAYSPETLIRQYGLPTRVTFFLSIYGGSPIAEYTMIMVFDEVDLIVEYSYGQVKPAEFVQVCPLTDKYALVSVWIGKDPKHPPFEGAPVDEAASMTITEFADLILGDPENACFDLIANAVP